MTTRLADIAADAAVLDSLEREDFPSLLLELASLQTVLVARMSALDRRPLREARRPRTKKQERPLLTTDQVAHRLGVSKQWVYRHKEELGGVSLSRKKLGFEEAAVERFLSERERHGGPC